MPSSSSAGGGAAAGGGRTKRTAGGDGAYKSKKGASKTTGRARDKTRRAAPRLIEGTENDERALSARLKHLGLYAANTLGDGSCLFRSLSDQLHGTPNHHLTIRSEVCNFLLYHQDEFIAFIDDSNHSSPQAAFAAHVAEMRMSATYGTQVEIVAFARMVKRRVKVIQAELVYVIGYEDESPSEREKRQSRRDGKGKAKEDGQDLPDLYVVYHNWEHYSSARNIQGPHTGLPCIIEQQQPMPGAEPNAKIEDEPKATQEESLILSSLRHPHRHTVIEIRKLIHDSGGSWEKALELLLENEVDETESEDFNQPSPTSAVAEGQEALPSIDVTSATPGLGIKAHNDLQSHRVPERYSSPSASSSTATSTTTHLSHSTTGTQLSDIQDQEKLLSSGPPSVSSRVRSRANSIDPEIQASESPRQRFRLHEPRDTHLEKEDSSSVVGGPDDLATLDGSSVVSAGSSAESASVESLEDTASASGASHSAAPTPPPPAPELAIQKPRRGRPPKNKDALKLPKVPTRRQRKQLVKSGGSPIVNRTRSKAPQQESGLQREFKELYV